MYRWSRCLLALSLIGLVEDRGLGKAEKCIGTNFSFGLNKLGAAALDALVRLMGNKLAI